MTQPHRLEGNSPLDRATQDIRERIDRSGLERAKLPSHPCPAPSSRRSEVAATLAPPFTPDKVVSFHIMPGTLGQWRATMAEGGPLIKCFEGSVTLVSPGGTHEIAGHRLMILILAICGVLKIPHTPLGSTYFSLPEGAKDSGYEPDEGFYIQSHATAAEGQAPDLAIEVVVSHSEKKALACGALLAIPEMWVLDIPRHRLTFYRLVRSGKHKGTYQPQPRSRAFPLLSSSDVLERLDDPERDAAAFHENCRNWVAEVLIPRRKAQVGGKG
jgi:Uma2 family endonuclease